MESAVPGKPDIQSLSLLHCRQYDALYNGWIPIRESTLHLSNPATLSIIPRHCIQTPLLPNALFPREKLISGTRAPLARIPASLEALKEFRPKGVESHSFHAQVTHRLPFRAHRGSRGLSEMLIDGGKFHHCWFAYHSLKTCSAKGCRQKCFSFSGVIHFWYNSCTCSAKCCLKLCPHFASLVLSLGRESGSPMHS